MSHEITSTKNNFKKYPPIPEGRRRYVIAAPVKKLYGKNSSEFFVWTLQYQHNGENCLGEQALMPNMMGPLLRVLGCQETEPENFDWDTDAVEGMAFVATTERQPDKKDPTIIRIHMSEYSGGLDEDAPEEIISSD